MKSFSLSAVTKSEPIANDLSLLAGMWDTKINVKVTKPSCVTKGSIEFAAFKPSFSKTPTVVYNPNIPQINFQPPASKAEKSEIYELQWFLDPKDILMDDPEALAQLYREAEEEDQLLAQIGLDHYVQVLKQEDNE